MRGTAILIISNLIILGILLLGIIALQIFLSKKQNKWLGLILPIINGAFSIIMGVGIFLYAITPPNSGSVILSMLVPLIVWNIPTVVLLVIYGACRESIKKSKEIDKMNIQDLE